MILLKPLYGDQISGVWACLGSQSVTFFVKICKLKMESSIQLWRPYSRDFLVSIDIEVIDGSTSVHQNIGANFSHLEVKRDTNI